MKGAPILTRDSRESASIVTPESSQVILRTANGPPDHASQCRNRTHLSFRPGRMIESSGMSQALAIEHISGGHGALILSSASILPAVSARRRNSGIPAPSYQPCQRIGGLPGSGKNLHYTHSPLSKRA